MTELEIDADEGILLETDEAILVSDGEKQIEWLVLTDKNLRIVTKHRTGLFSYEDITQTIPLKSVKVVNGRPLVELKSADDYSHCMQIQSAQGRDIIFFEGGYSKKIAEDWISEIHGLLGAEYVPQPTVADCIYSGITGVAAGLKKAVVNAAQSSQKPKSDSGGVQFASSPMTQATASSAPHVCFFRNGGFAMHPRSKFCPECGASNAVGQNCSASTASSSQPDAAQRRVEYQGVISKCPNCGGEVHPLDAVCDFCGYKISGRAANATVVEFNRQLMAIESTRKRRILKSQTIDATDRQIITLINTFPIPNNVAELTEFMFMSASNIDVRYSKKGIFSSSNLSTPEGAISNAWLSKMEQIYKKASVAFGDDPLFDQIRDTYETKMRELKRL